MISLPDQLTKFGNYRKVSGSTASSSKGLQCVEECMDSNAAGRCIRVKITSDEQCLYENGVTSSPAITDYDFYITVP